MKKVFAMVCMMILLSGCAVTAPGETTAPTISAETTSQTATEANHIADTFPTDASTEELRVYVADVNCDLDIYLDSTSRTCYLYVLSNQKLSENDFQIDIPKQTSFHFVLSEDYLGVAPNELQTDLGAPVMFTYDIYLNYLGFDWGELASKKQAVSDAEAAMKKDNTSENRNRYVQASTEFNDYYQMHWDDYLRLDQFQIPQFYSYVLMINFEVETTTQFEQIQTMQLQVKDKILPLQVGEICLYPQNQFDPESTTSDFLKDVPIVASTPISVPSGTVEIVAHFTADTDLTLTGFDVISNCLDIESTCVRTISDGKYGIDFVWDRHTPIHLEAGDGIEIPTVIAGEVLKTSGFLLDSIVRLEYEVDGKVQEYTYNHQFTHIVNPYETFAKYFDGIDFTEYYEKYYYPIVSGIE